VRDVNVMINLQTNSTDKSMTGLAQQYRADAVRYAVLRKLAPGLRHSMMGELQAIQLSAELASRMLRSGADVAKVRHHVDHMPGQCAAAVKTSRSVIAWLRPEENATVALRSGLNQCVKVASDDWFLRGIEVRVDVLEPDVLVASEALQELVVAALLVLADMFDQPADLRIVATVAERHVDVMLQGDASTRTASFPPMIQYRKLLWDDLAVLASVMNVECVYAAAQVSMRLPRADALAEAGGEFAKGSDVT
jgi:hypothetical protein